MTETNSSKQPVNTDIISTLTATPQAQYWNDTAVTSDLQARQSGVTDFAIDTEKLLARNSKVLELGSGAGDDAAYFSEQGHSVLGLDVSIPLVEIAAQRYADHDNLEFRVADITAPFPVSGQSIDAVYSRWALHYFDHSTTLRVFSEIAWVLRPGGQFHFGVRCTKDPLYGKGLLIEPDCYELDGHLRHFFDVDYTIELLELNNFTKIEVSLGAQKLYGLQAAYLKGVCTKV